MDFGYNNWGISQPSFNNNMASDWSSNNYQSSFPTRNECFVPDPRFHLSNGINKIKMESSNGSVPPMFNIPSNCINNMSFPIQGYGENSANSELKPFAFGSANFSMPNYYGQGNYPNYPFQGGQNNLMNGNNFDYSMYRNLDVKFTNYQDEESGFSAALHTSDDNDGSTKSRVTKRQLKRMNKNSEGEDKFEVKREIINLDLKPEIKFENTERKVLIQAPMKRSADNFTHNGFNAKRSRQFYNPENQRSGSGRKITFISMVVIDKGHPNGIISPENWTKVELKTSALFLSLLREFPGPAPIIKDIGWRNNFKALSFSNKRSLDIYKIALQRVGEIWPKAQLILVSESCFGFKPTLQCFLPIAPDKPRDILEVIEVSNPKLTTSKWSVRQMDKAKDGRRLVTFNIPREDIPTILKADNTITFGFAPINVSINENKSIQEILKREEKTEQKPVEILKNSNKIVKNTTAETAAQKLKTETQNTKGKGQDIAIVGKLKPCINVKGEPMENSKKAVKQIPAVGKVVKNKNIANVRTTIVVNSSKGKSNVKNPISKIQAIKSVQNNIPKKLSNGGTLAKATGNTTLTKKSTGDLPSAEKTTDNGRLVEKTSKKVPLPKKSVAENVSTENSSKDGHSVKNPEEDGIVEKCIKDGLSVEKSNDLSVEKSIEDGDAVEKSSADSLPIEKSTEDDHSLEKSTEVGLSVEKSIEAETGISVEKSTETVLSVEKSTEDGLSVEKSTEAGLSVEKSTEAGLSVENFTEAGLSVEKFTEDDLPRETSTEDGLPVKITKSDDVFVEKCNEDGPSAKKSTESALSVKASIEVESHLKKLNNNSSIATAIGRTNVKNTSKTLASKQSSTNTPTGQFTASQAIKPSPKNNRTRAGRKIFQTKSSSGENNILAPAASIIPESEIIIIDEDAPEDTINNGKK